MNSRRNKDHEGAVHVTTFPGDLTTPPLTPPGPREEGEVTSEPVNGNRNNVSDSVHAKSVNLKARKTHDLGLTGPNGVTRQRLAESPCERAENTNHMHAAAGSRAEVHVQPPALVIIGNGGKEEGEVQREMAAGENTPEELERNVLHSNGEPVPSQYPNAYSSSNHGGGGGGSSDGGGGGEHGSVQSMKVTSAGDGGESVSSEDEEEVEDIELVLVEDEEGAEEVRRRDHLSKRLLDSDFAKQSSDDVTGLARGMNQQQQQQQQQQQESAMARRNGSSTGKGANMVSHRQRHHQLESRKEVARNGHVPSAAIHSLHKNHTPLEYQVSRSTNNGFHGGGGGGGGGGRKESGTGKSASVTSKQAAKVKQVFTTIQQHGNKLGSEVAEQVQELIHALVVSNKEYKIATCFFLVAAKPLNSIFSP